MRFAHVVRPGGASATLVIVDDEGAVPVPTLIPDGPSTLEQLIAGGPQLLDAVREAAAGYAGERLPIADVSFAPAVLAPPTIMAIGLNYAAHSGELNLKTDDTPTVFTLWPNSIAAHNATTTWSRSLAKAVDYEAELGVIIGTPARDVSEQDALSHVFGYTVVNDITARDIQYSEAQWCRAKSLDGFTPVGPYVVTADEIPDPQSLHIWTVLDGHTMQDSTTGSMVRTVAKLISHLSKGITLMPGTLISTGSPGGSGYSRTPQVLMRDRSVVTVGIDGIGELTTHCRVVD
ncbi:fumarylacetoacetate hydrolase family protein [Microbacterium stercoris]|uniref:Fumarylacetoacetate hydrolase family protein n=1 Tax=Microbacterium stercoris TaxID=2820289 RepID=A0A939TML3_9MICO|nr:fumarylacetoacetate hydrolase family protein [Microbacterium stercoris]MBO3663313.1 fumarylacetoacetate hydrolase family protein [Microbacterium stercoris]